MDAQAYAVHATAAANVAMALLGQNSCALDVAYVAAKPRLTIKDVPIIDDSKRIGERMGMLSEAPEAPEMATAVAEMAKIADAAAPVSSRIMLAGIARNVVPTIDDEKEAQGTEIETITKTMPS